jgi:trehalose 6-phosphate synthase/phosphatase
LGYDQLMSSHRLLIVSNRLPVAATPGEDGVRLTRASGGLAVGLSGYHDRSDSRWIGWPGDVSDLDPAERRALDDQLARQRIVPVVLSQEDVNGFYHGFANRVLWPLFHYQLDRVPVDARGWDAYRRVNQLFADVIAREYRAGDVIWVHDYQLMLLPSLLRERLPESRIGFFLHIPFPSSEVFRVLPWRREILNGLIGADLLGFHTFAYLRHFLASLLHIEGVETDIDRIRIGDRNVELGVFPMGVDAQMFSALARDPEVLAEAAAIRQEAGGRRIVLGVDRLDYTKGIPRRLEAIQRLLERDSALCDQMRYIQVAIPSREEVDSYQRFKRQVEERIGRINGACGTLRSTPIHYVHRSVSLRQLVALYCAADVMLVTPLRDGMNLVAKEFAASRVDEDGVLVLSEFAGAAAELDGAVIVNPFDIDAVADAVRRALDLSAGERKARMQALRVRVTQYDVNTWASAFLAKLENVRQHTPETIEAGTAASLISALSEARGSRRVRLLLDYDGTLVPLARSPELAAPDAELLTLLDAVAAVPGFEVDIVSGRPRQTLTAWFDRLMLSLWAEHGFWHRPRGSETWQPAARVPADWMKRLRPILEQFTASTPGSHIEEKCASVAWHYRRAQREFGSRQAHELRMLLGDALSNQPFEVLEGKKVIEVRLRGVTKAVVADQIQQTACEGSTVIAIGDDRTDEDLFRALPRSCVTVAVGTGPTCARFQVPDHRAVRALLRLLLAAKTGGQPLAPEDVSVQESVAER